MKPSGASSPCYSSSATRCSTSAPTAGKASIIRTCAFQVGLAVSEGRAERGILICGTGIGMCIAANKVKGVRAAPCHDYITAEMSRRHNNANVLCLSADLLGEELIDRMVRIWLETDFESGRHARRVEKIIRFEEGGKRPRLDGEAIQEPIAGRGSSFGAGGDEGLEGFGLAGHPGAAGVDDGQAETLGSGHAGQTHAHLAVRDDLQGPAAIEGIVTIRDQTDLINVGQGDRLAVCAA